MTQNAVELDVDEYQQNVERAVDEVRLRIHKVWLDLDERPSGDRFRFDVWKAFERAEINYVYGDAAS